MRPNADVLGDDFIRVEHIAYAHSNRSGVHSVDLRLNRGDVLGLLGRNGAGKTTTLKMLAGVLHPQRGRVLIDGRDLYTAGSNTRGRLGYLPDKPPVHPIMTVTTYLRFCAQLRNTSGAVLNQHVDEAIARCGLEEVSNRRIGKLSKGQQQRVGLAQAIVHRPEFIVLDEPTVGLDPLQILSTRALIRELSTSSCIVISSHQLAEVQAICNKVQIIDAGKPVLFRDLDEPMAATVVRVGFDHAPSLSILETLSAVSGVRSLGDNRVQLRTGDRNTTTAALLSACREHGWTVNELDSRGDDLEDVFISIVAGHDEHPPE